MPISHLLGRIATDIDILELFCTIIEKRMFIIDDKEFVGEKQSLMSSFLPVTQMLDVSLLLNFIIYQIY